MRDLRQRKPNRMANSEYSKNGAYFITVCIQDKHEILWESGATCARPPLSEIGETVENEITRISSVYRNVVVDCFVVMPNHVHMILVVTANGQTQIAPTISRIIKQWKGSISKKIGFSPWQKSFHDHIIRDKNDYYRIVQYIENNPSNWEDDYFYTQPAKPDTPV